MFANQQTQGPVNRMITCLISLFSLGICIAAIVISVQQKNNPCPTASDTIVIQYVDWLLSFGIIGLVAIPVILIGLMFFGVNNEQVRLISGCVIIIYVLFSFSWLIVGFVLYFQDIHGSCPAKDSLYVIGLIIFISTSVGCGLGCIRECLKCICPQVVELAARV